MNEFLAYVCILNTVLILICIKAIISALIELKGLQNSTHNVTWMPWDQADDKKLQEQMKTPDNLPEKIDSEYLNNIMMDNF